jgi:hypothetical protein
VTFHLHSYRDKTPYQVGKGEATTTTTTTITTTTTTTIINAARFVVKINVEDTNHPFQQRSTRGAATTITTTTTTTTGTTTGTTITANAVAGTRTAELQNSRFLD